MKRHISTLILAGILGACTTSGDLINDARGLDPAGGEFGAALYQGYLGLSQDERDEKDRSDADRFAQKAINVARSGDVMPESLDSRHIRSKYRGEALAMYRRLIDARTDHARENAPDALARAQIMFDCYMQEREENFQRRQIARCRAGFETALQDIAKAPKVTSETSAPTRTPPRVETPVVEQAAPMSPAAPMAPADHMKGAYTVYFDFDSAVLDEEAIAILAGVLVEVDRQDNVLIHVDGHADRAGPDDYNEALSALRAEAVISYLVASGIKRAQIEHLAHGERDPLIATQDGVRERRNRRAHILIR